MKKNNILNQIPMIDNVQQQQNLRREEVALKAELPTEHEEVAINEEIH